MCGKTKRKERKSLEQISASFAETDGSNGTKTRHGTDIDVQRVSSGLKPRPESHLHTPQKARYLCSFRSPVHLYAKIIAVLLPVKFAVHHVEQVAHADLVPGRKLHEGHSRWDVFVLGNPERNDVIAGGPGEVSVDDQHRQRACTQSDSDYLFSTLEYFNLLNSVYLQTLLIQETHRLREKQKHYAFRRANMRRPQL